VDHVVEPVVPVSAPPTQAWMTDVEREFRDRDPAAFFVWPRVIRRVLRNELEITSPWVRVPHRKSYVIPRERLIWLVAPDELGIDAATEIPNRALLISRPEDDRLQGLTPDDLRRTYWRLLYHARLDAAMQARVDPKGMSLAQLRQRIDRLGQEQFDEIRAVLKHEAMLTRPDDLRQVYAEFVAVFHELRAFTPDLLPLYFPSLRDRDEVARILAEDCPAAALLESTRPRGMTAAAAAADHQPGEITVPQLAPPSKWRTRGLMRAAARLTRRGNAMRAALLLQRAELFAPVEQQPEIHDALQAQLDQFARRLQVALELDDADVVRWRAICAALLHGADRGFWTVNARLLYDLQKVCIDHERELYRVDLWGWIRHFGQRTLQQPLPDLRLVRITKHLRTALRRVGAARIGPEIRRELSGLLHAATERAEEILRGQLEPQLRGALEVAGIVPRDPCERVAFHKLTAELLDNIAQRGFLTIGNLRDSLSQGQLKLADLTSPREFFTGDALLRADRRLAATLQGVYQKGPFYLRWLQRVNSLFFGTPVGRWLTKYLALPFGGAFIILKGLHLLGEEVHELLHTPKLHIYSHETMLGLGCFLFLLIHWPAFRRGTVLTLRATWTLLWFLLHDLPRWLYRFPPVAWVLKSLPAMLFRRYLFSPLAVTLLLWKGFPQIGLYPELSPWSAVATLVASFVVLNSRFGRDGEELLWEWLGKAWHRFRVTVIIGLFNLIMDLFRQVLDALERVLYSVDEWLRFRAGESQLSLVVKAALGPIWSFVNGIIRFCVTLLIEPQVNPIKHFPVVTVSHKLLLPSLPYMIALLDTLLVRSTAVFVATVIITCIPGVFGFLAWELKENWRQYAANRPPKLKPVLIGHHGETMLRLLRPGFHSGTIPKLFARRRRTARKQRLHPELSKQGVFDERLHHEAEAIRHFVERELLALLAGSQRLKDAPLAVASVELSTNRVTVTLSHGDHPDTPARLTFAEQSGWLIAGLSEPGWMRLLDRDQKIVLGTALAGLYHLGAVNLVREQIESRLGSPPHPYDIDESGLTVWPTRSFEAEVHYPLDEHPTIAPRPRSVARLAGLQPLPAGALLFEEHPIAWEAWRTFWTDEATRDICPDPLLRDVTILRG
jgi:hypothetical protein